MGKRNVEQYLSGDASVVCPGEPQCRAAPHPCRSCHDILQNRYLLYSANFIKFQTEIMNIDIEAAI